MSFSKIDKKSYSELIKSSPKIKSNKGVEWLARTTLLCQIYCQLSKQVQKQNI